MNRFFTFLLFCTALYNPCRVFAEGSLDIDIPVVDMRDFYDMQKRDMFLDTLHHAMTKIGFFAVRNTGVKADTIKTAYKEAELFFKSDLDEKMLCQTQNTKGQRGFVTSEYAKGNVVKDYKEYYHIGRENIQPANVWPKDPLFKEAMVALYEELNQYVLPLQEAIVAVINRDAKESIPSDFLNAMTMGGDTLIRALYYPALTDSELSEMKKPLFWATEHTDIDLLAILPFSTARGLQVELNGEWKNVIVPEDAFVINVGDMLENLTNGLFVSARHRVLAQEPNCERFSMVLFVHPRGEADLSPLATCILQTGGIQRYAPCTRNEMLWERLLELGIAPGLLEQYAATGHTERQIAFGRESPQVVQMLTSNGFLSPS